MTGSATSTPGATAPTELVSVVIPVFDRPRAVVEAVESVLAQEGVEVEVVVVDDGSGPATAAAVDRLAEEHAAVRVVHQPNAGPGAARNRGVRETTGHWLTFLDSDDLMPAGRLREQLEHLAALEGPALVMGEERVEVAPGVVPPPSIALRLRFHRPHWYAMSLCTTRATFDLIGGFDESMRLGEDTELLYRAKARGVTQLRIERIWTVRRVFGDNLVADDDGVRRSALVALRKHLSGREPHA